MKTELEGRPLEFALKVIDLAESLPQTPVGAAIARQLVKSGTSAGANYREAGRAESKEDFIHKIAIAETEAAEREYWLLIRQRREWGRNLAPALLDEARQLPAIFTASGRNAKKR